MANNLTFRLFQPDDIAGVLQLWEESSGWGSISEEQFCEWYVETPYGEALLVVALDEANCVVGQEVFIPSKVYVDGTEKKALRISAPILAKEFRGEINDGPQTIIEMYRVGIKAAIEKGYSIIYFFPVVSYLPFFRRFSSLLGLKANQFIATTFDCYALSTLSRLAENLAVEEAVEVSIATEFNEEYDRLWQDAKNEFPINCAVVRSSGWLKWKLGSHCVFEVRRKEDKELIGYAAIKKKTGLLVDALARTPKDLETVVRTAIETLLESNDLKNHAKIEEIKIMKTDVLASIIEKLGFIRNEFQFGFYCYSLDDTIAMQSLEPSRWYLMPND